jgi:hypothetical protein
MIAAFALSLFSFVMTPADAAKACSDHAATLAPAVANQTRYVQSIAADDEGRKADYVAVTYMVNYVSGNRLLYRPNVMAEGEIIIIDLAAISDPNDPASFKVKFDAWEQLASIDPYWHIKTEVDAGKDKPKVQTVAGGWCSEPMGKLAEATGSGGALLRADFFVARAGAEEFDLFAGTAQTLDEFLKGFGVNEAEVARLQGQVAANIMRSNVRTGRAPRRIIGDPGVHGPVLVTKDGDSDDAKSNPFYFPVNEGGDREFKPKAYEVFALGANGFWKTSIYNADRKIVAEVPDKVAKDRFGDGIIRNGVSCVRCHSTDGGTAGVQAFEDVQHKINGQGVKAYDPTVLQAILANYDPLRMAKQVKRAQEDHHDAVVSVCGTKTPDEAVQILSGVFGGYRDSDVTVSVAAHEVGMTPVEFTEVMQASGNPTIRVLLLGQPISRGQWEPVYHECILLAERWRADQ